MTDDERYEAWAKAQPGSNEITDAKVKYILTVAAEKDSSIAMLHGMALGTAISVLGPPNSSTRRAFTAYLRAVDDDYLRMEAEWKRLEDFRDTMLTD